MKLVDEEFCPCKSGKLYGECHKTVQRTTNIVTALNHISLTIIPEPSPNTRTVFKLIGTGPTTPNGRYSLDCGSCGASLVVVNDLQQFSNIVLQCATCGEFNDT